MAKRRVNRHHKTKVVHWIVSCFLIGIIVNALVLHNYLDNTVVVINSHNDKNSSSPAILFHMNSLSVTRTMRQKHVDHPVSTKRRLVDNSIKEMDDNNSDILNCVRDAMERQFHTCQNKQEGGSKVVQHAEHSNQGGTFTFGLLKALKQRFQKNSKGMNSTTRSHDCKRRLGTINRMCCCAGGNASRSNNNNMTRPHIMNQNSSSRMVLIVTSSGQDIRNLFINHLKWLNVEQIHPIQQRSLLYQVPIVMEQIWLLLPTHALSVLEHNEDYGKRILEWDRQISHPVKIRHGISFWDAIGQVELITSSSDIPILLLDGDRQSLSSSSLDLSLWIQQRLQNWYADDASSIAAIIPSSTTTSGGVDGGAAGSSRRENTRSVMTQEEQQRACRMALEQEEENNPPFFLPSFHLSIHRASQIVLLQHPVIAQVRHETNGSADWNIAQLSAILWLSWLSYETNGSIIIKNNNKDTTNLDDDDHHQLFEEKTTNRWNDVERHAIARILVFFGGVPICP